MKTKLSLLMISAAILSLTACNKNDDSKPAAVPVAPERVFARSFNGTLDQANYCDISGTGSGQKSLVCYSPQNNYNPIYQNQNQNQNSAATCASISIQFTDATLCNTLQQVLYQNQNQCGILAMQSLYNQRCLTNGIPNQTLNPGFPVPVGPNIPQPSFPGATPTDPNYRVINCDFEASRTVQGKIFERTYNTGHMTTSMTVDSRMAQTINLRSLFLGFDIGSFGKTEMIYTPAGLKGSADTIKVSNNGLNETISMSQSGFAGEEVKLDAQSDDGLTRLMVSCKGQGKFKKNTTTTVFSKLNCKGTSNLGARKEQVNLSLPYNTNLLGHEISLAENLVLTVSGDSSAQQDNARLTLTASNVDVDLTVQTSAYLKTAGQIKIDDGYTAVDVTCSPSR